MPAWPTIWHVGSNQKPGNQTGELLKFGSKEIPSDADSSPMSPDSPFLRSSTRSLNLDEVLRSEFRGAYGGEEVARQQSGTTELSQVEVFSSEGHEECSKFVDSHSFMSFFLVLTVYALFAQDLDTIYGTPQSRFVMSIVTTIIFGLFFIELVLQCLFKAGYAFKAFFWLDIVALISLLPETWFVQQLFNSDTLVAGRSTRLMKAIRLVVRSSKATRLNRFTRMVRVSAMLPKMCAGFHRKPVENGKDVENLVQRKLDRIYVYLERENDGLVSAEDADAIIRRITKRRKHRRSITRLWTKKFGADRGPSMTRQNSDVSEADISPHSTVKTFGSRPRSRSVVVRSTYSDGGDSPDGTGSMPMERRIRKMQTSFTTHTDQSNPSQTESCMRGSRSRSRSKGGGVTIRIDGDDGTQSMPMQGNTISRDDVDAISSSETVGRRVEKIQTYRSLHSNHSTPLPVKKESSGSGDELDLPAIPWQRGISDPVSAENFSHQQTRAGRKFSRKSTQSSTLSINRNASSASIQTEDDEDPLKLTDFKERVLSDIMVKTKLFYACQSQLGKGTTMKNIGRRHVEDVGVKVALMVIILLFVLSFVVPQSQDTSVPLVLEQLDMEARYRFSDWSNDTLPPELLTKYLTWKEGLVASPQKPTLLYLDLSQRVVCNEMVESAATRKCSSITGATLVPWPSRDSLKSIDAAIRTDGLPYRADDLEFFRHPVVDETDTSQDLDQIVTSVALLDLRYLNEQGAVNSLVISWTVILIILVGMFTITRDLGHLSRKLLEPLRVLADEMQSIAHINLAAISKEDKVEVEQGAREVQLIQHIFNKTKVAIISWARYVPWPVVQNLLAAGVQVTPSLDSREVSLFFSDMAGFTSIVEQLVPEQTLVLLSRYFNDMSKIIESFDGVVIEYIGDAILAVFGAPGFVRDHALACVRAMLKMQRGVQKINHWSRKKGLPHVSIRCGIHSGWVSFGNMGFHSRLKFGVIGENANVPAKLEELNKTYGTQNLISQATYDRLPVEEFIVRPVDYVNLWHIEDCQEPVYEVMSYLGTSRPSWRYNLRDALAQKYQHGLNYYQSRKFDKAEAIFREVSSQMGQHFGTFDKASVVMRKRASYYQSHPPPADWAGIWTLPREPNETDGVEEDVVYVSI